MEKGKESSRMMLQGSCLSAPRDAPLGRKQPRGRQARDAGTSKDTPAFALETRTHTS